ncbi:MAG TPA: choice-of-anchor tandem repeat GloVer-containing protein [Candidatus Sulfotelmatobacter sp.]
MRPSKLVLALVLALVAVIAAPMEGQSTFKLLHAFLGGNDGFDAVSGVTLGPNGSVYGITPEGGSSVDGGVIFYISPGGWYKVIHVFTGGADGKNPYSSLLAMGGNFYGTTSQGGAYGSGTIFKIAPSDAMSVLYNFSGRGRAIRTDDSRCGWKSLRHYLGRDVRPRHGVSS